MRAWPIRRITEKGGHHDAWCKPSISPKPIAPATSTCRRGFVFQDFNLIPVLTVFENVEYPLRMVQLIENKWPAEKRRAQVLRLRAAWLKGGAGSEFGEKQNARKLELMLRYYF